MRTPIALVFLLAASVTPGRTQSPTEFTGRLEPQAVPERMATAIALTPASDEARAKLGGVAAAGEAVWTGDLTFGSGKQPVYVIQAADGGIAVATDLDRNGTIAAPERVPLARENASEPRLTTILRIATPGGSFSDYPVRVGITPAALSKATPASGGEPPRVYLSTSYRAFATGSVPVDGKPVKVQLIVFSKDFLVDPSRSYQYVDCNGDGTMDEDMTSWEMGYGRGAPVVFHLGTGDRYVSIKSVNVKAGTITLVAREAADYDRIELRVGAAIPDFPFKALDGSVHRLSEFRGKYLLLDFWGTWCGPCVGEIPYLKKAYEAYKDKGFEILGMDNELPDVTPEDFAKGLEGVKKFVAEKGVAWMQAQTESIKPLYERRFQIVAWPTTILLDPKGVIVSVGRSGSGEPGLRGDSLDRTLAEIFKGK